MQRFHGLAHKYIFLKATGQPSEVFNVCYFPLIRVPCSGPIAHIQVQIKINMAGNT